MAHQAFIDSEREFGLIQWKGVVQGGDVLWAMEHLYGHPAWRLGYRSCWDGRGTTEFLLELKDMKQVAALAREQVAVVGEAPVANVIPNELHLVTVKMLARFTRLRHLNFGFFRSSVQAADWLGIPDDWIDAPTGRVAQRGGLKGTGPTV